jgi:hypothetical protein
MTIVQQIQQDIVSLPQERQQEVWDFVCFLKLRTQGHRGNKTENHELTQNQPHGWDALEQIGQTLSEKWDPQQTAADAVAAIRR